MNDALASQTAAETAPLAGYDPANGWSFEEAAHLLRRAQYGASRDEIARAVDDGLAATVDRLTTPQAESAGFLETASLLHRTAIDAGSIDDLKVWWLYRMLHSANPLVEKASLFWHNHFATSNAKVGSVKQMSDQNALIRTHALGDFRKLLHGMTRDVAMLVWLDGNANRKRQPNENFAREVMELFSLGEGNYSEQDIKEAARAFTGWHVRHDQFWFNRIQHDKGAKTVFGKTAPMDGDDVVELCLAQPACPRFLASKLLNTFVAPHAANDFTERVAGRIRTHNYAIAPVLREVFSSGEFFSPSNRAAIIKSPLDLVLGSIRVLDGRPNLRTARSVLAELGQDVFEPATVKGWEGGRLWINSATLLQRANFAAELTKGGRLGSIAEPFEIAKSENLTDPTDVLKYFSRLLLGRNPDVKTTEELATFANSSDGDRNTRLRSLIHAVMTLPEYQLV